MLLRLGFVMTAVAAVFAGLTIAVVSTQETTRSAASRSESEPATKPLERGDPMVEPWREEAVKIPGPKEPEPDPEPEPAVAASTSPAPEPDPEPREPAPPSTPPPEPEPEPVVDEQPPEPTDEEVATAHRPRRYHLPDGAVLGLTVKAIGIRDVPVFDSVGDSALTYGVGHHPETSMPWTEAPQRNVYIAGHKLGWPGTASHLIFYRLNELGEGDEIILKDRDGDKYTYHVTETFKANPGDSWVMGQVVGRDMVTLQTCTGPNWERRLIVRADRL